MNKERVAPLRIISALKQEALCRKSRQEDESTSISVSKASTGTEDKSQLHCSFCKRDGHDLEHCFTAGQILENHHSRQKQEDRSASSSNKPKTNKSKKAEKAGNTTVVQIVGKYSSKADDSDDSGSSVGAKQQTARNAQPLHNIESCSVAVCDANLDSGCSMSMTPYLKDVISPKPDNTPVRLADHSTVKATHRGKTSLPLSVATEVPTLVVPDLHEPLLAISGLCNQNLTIVFNKSNCRIFSSSNSDVVGNPIGVGY
jgi:hypothetical protein